MIQERFYDIDREDIEFLISNKTAEMKTLEYKEKLPGHSDSEKKEFLADVSSFANASGGDMIFGIAEKLDSEDKTRKIPVLSPITGCSVDKEKLRLEEIIRNGISPRLLIQIKEISGWDTDQDSFILIIRIQKSFNSPHMVTFQKTSRFYSRNSAGKYQLDVNEIRSAFLATESQADRISRFINERLSRIVADETPVFLSSESRLVLHIIPIVSFLNNDRIDFVNLETNLKSCFRPIVSSGWDDRHNIDGILLFNPTSSSSNCRSYCQLFHCGAIESVYSEIIYKQDERNLISIQYEKHVIESIEMYLQGYEKIGVEPPLIISMSLINCKNVELNYNVRHFFINSRNFRIDRDNLLLPNVKIEDLDVDIPKAMKPIFDSVWNACGYPFSYNYDENGNWNPR